MTGRFVLTLALAAGCLLSCSSAQNKQAPRHITYWEKWTGFEAQAMDAVIDDFKIDADKLRAVGRMSGYDYARTRDRFALVRPA